jgi:hypothetical protein
MDTSADGRSQGGAAEPTPSATSDATTLFSPYRAVGALDPPFATARLAFFG